MRYFKEPELTRESLTDDGWFKSGDIGQWEANGTLSIIDRVKNLVSRPRHLMQVKFKESAVQNAKRGVPGFGPGGVHVQSLWCVPLRESIIHILTSSKMWS